METEKTDLDEVFERKELTANLSEKKKKAEELEELNDSGLKEKERPD